MRRQVADALALVAVLLASGPSGCTEGGKGGGVADEGGSDEGGVLCVTDCREGTGEAGGSEGTAQGELGGESGEGEGTDEEPPNEGGDEGTDEEPPNEGGDEGAGDFERGSCDPGAWVDPADDPQAYIDDATYRCAVLGRDLLSTESEYAQQRDVSYAHADTGWDALPARDVESRPFTREDLDGYPRGLERSSVEVMHRRCVAGRRWCRPGGRRTGPMAYFKAGAMVHAALRCVLGGVHQTDRRSRSVLAIGPRAQCATGRRCQGETGR